MAALVPRRRLREVTAAGLREDQRPSAAARGYGWRWQRTANGFLRKHPLCVHCRAKGRTTIARCVDHIEPVSGAHDPKFWVRENWQPLCISCHSRKTMTEDRGHGRRGR